MISHIHHINFLVRNLEAAIARYQSLFPGHTIIREDLPQRGVATARLKAGSTWIVLLEPRDPENVPGRYLEQHGEGFFLISYVTDDLDAECSRLDEAGLMIVDNQARQGLDDWLVRDFANEQWFGVNTQLTQQGR